MDQGKTLKRKLNDLVTVLSSLTKNSEGKGLVATTLKALDDKYALTLENCSRTGSRGNYQTTGRSDLSGI